MVSNDKFADIRALRIIEIRNILKANVEQQNAKLELANENAAVEMSKDLNKIDKLVEQMKGMPASMVNQARVVLVGAGGGSENTF